MKIPSVVYSAVQAAISSACKQSTTDDMIFDLHLSHGREFGGWGNVLLNIHNMKDLSPDDAVIYREDLDNVIRLANCIQSLQLTPVDQDLTSEESWQLYCSYLEELTELVKSGDFRKLRRYIQSFELD